MKFYVPEQRMRRNSSTVLSECRKQLQIFFQGHIIQPDPAKSDFCKIGHNLHGTNV